MIDSDIKKYLDEALEKNFDEIRLYHQPASHMIDQSPPLNNIGVNGHVRLLDGPTKKIYVKMGGKWFSTPVS